MPARVAQSFSRVRLRSRDESRAGFATLAVLWTIAIVTIALAVLQGVSFRQAAAGREVLARVRAHWAARAGVEAQIAKLTSNSLSPDLNSAFTIGTDLANAATGTLQGASFAVRHFEDGRLVDGAADAHAKLNVNTMGVEELLLLDGMDEGTANAISAWIRGGDDSTAAAGASDGVYQALRYPYKPRGAAMRSLAEVELVQGVTLQNLRGEDWNANGLLDPNENDGELTSPRDNADGVLDAGWSQYLTAASELGGLSASGKKRIDLKTASQSDITSRLKVDSEQARVIAAHAQTGELPDYVRSTLAQLDVAATGGGGTLLSGQAASTVTPLTNDQLRTLLDEAIVGDPRTTLPHSGLININSVTRQTLERQTRIDADTADAIIQARQGRSGGFTSMMDLLEVSGITRESLSSLMEVIDVRSNVYIATSKGRDSATGIEVEIVAELDRSTIPVVIKSLVVR